jgi:hypothetical protein
MGVLVRSLQYRDAALDRFGLLLLGRQFLCAPIEYVV